MAMKVSFHIYVYYMTIFHFHKSFTSHQIILISTCNYHETILCSFRSKEIIFLHTFKFKSFILKKENILNLFIQFNILKQTSKHEFN